MAILRVLLLLSLPVLVLGAEVNQIVVDRFLPNKVSLYVANADGTGATNLTMDPAADRNARWAPCPE